MKRNAIIGLLLLGVVGCGSPPQSAHEATQLAPPATEVHHNRFQIIQSDLAARWTFRLDRFTGDIEQLVQKSDESLSWEPMEVLQKVNVLAPSHPRFEMFTSKLAVKFTFMIDTESGKTWQLVSQSPTPGGGQNQGKVVWQPL